MKIGIDFDCTLTADLNLFSDFIRDAKDKGHDVRIVTYRHFDNTSDNILEIAADLDIDIIFTNHVKKHDFCEQLGWLPDIWVDDKPEHI